MPCRTRALQSWTVGLLAWPSLVPLARPPVSETNKKREEGGKEGERAVKVSGSRIRYRSPLGQGSDSAQHSTSGALRDKMGQEEGK